MKTIKQFFYTNWWVILGIIIGSFLIIKNPNNQKTPIEIITKTTHPSAEIINFGSWTPDGNRTIVGTVESESNINIPAELNGKINKIYVDMGDPVTAGQALASFDIRGDQTYINYKNALNNLESTQNNTKSSAGSTKLNLINAEKEYEQLLLQLQQNKKATLESLKNTVSNTATAGLNILNYFDSQIGASSKYNTQFAIARNHIGSNNQILKIQVQNDIRSLQLTYDNLISKIIPSTADSLISISNEYLYFLKQLKNSAQNYNILIQGTIVTNTFSNNQKEQVSNLTEAKNTQIDQVIAQLNTQVQTIKNLNEQHKNQILSAKNRIENALANIELNKTQSDGQIKSAQNTVDLAASQKSDLIVRSPFSGKITEKFIREGQFVSPGLKLFSMINVNKEKKVVAFFLPSEITRLKNQQIIKIEYENEIIEVSNFIEGITINPETQKIRIDFILPENKTILPGKTVKVLISSDNQINMIPLSAISFEPNGTQEVLVLNKNNTLERRKVQIEHNLSDGIIIKSGLEYNDKVIKYKKQFYSGQEVVMKK